MRMVLYIVTNQQRTLHYPSVLKSILASDSQLFWILWPTISLIYSHHFCYQAAVLSEIALPAQH